MTLSAWFWILYVLGALFGLTWAYRAEPTARPWYGAFFVLTWVEIGLLGYAFFSGPLKG